MYDHEDKSVAISLALMPELAERLQDLDPETNTTGAMAGRGNPFIAGAGSEQTSATAYRFVEMHALNS
jgi:hypothetical protein